MNWPTKAKSWSGTPRAIWPRRPRTVRKTTYVYTADGQRLIRRDPQAITLYLGNQEIRLDRTSKIKTGTRYYTHGSQTIAVRTQAGLNWLGRDHHGTDEVSVNSVTQQTSRRRQFPFGEPRGTNPSIWPGERGFVGGTIDTSTGLTHLGAREYDPTLGRFISVDPIMDLGDPQQMNGYTYSNNNPATFADPSGLKFFEGDTSGAIDSGACKDGKCGNPTVCACPKSEKDLEKKVIQQFSPKTNDLNQLISMWQYFAGPQREDYWNMGIGDGENACFGRTGCHKAWLYILDHPDDIAGAKKIAATYCVDHFDECAGEADFERFVNNAMYDELMLAGLRAGGSGRNSRACSFSGDTEVLMSDGTTKSIKDVRVGDQVQAADPETGETGAKTVVAVWRHQSPTMNGSKRNNSPPETASTPPMHAPFVSPVSIPPVLTFQPSTTLSSVTSTPIMW